MRAFEKFCATLQLDPKKFDSAKLGNLRSWCMNSISTDIDYSDYTEEEQYQKYLMLAEQYINTFLANIPSDMTASVPEFDHMTTIQFAATKGYDVYIKQVQLKPKHDASLSQATNRHPAPIHIAAIKGHLNTVTALLEKGAPADTKNRIHQLPLYSALMLPIVCSPGLQSKKTLIYKVLEQKQTSHTSKQKAHIDTNGDSVCHLMAVHGFNDLLEDALRRNPSLAALRNNHSLSPLLIAIMHNQFSCATPLLRVEGAAEVPDSKRRVAIHYAAIYGSTEMIGLCCDHHVNLNAVDTDKKTPFMLAIESKRLSAMRILSERGADTTMTDSLGHNALHLAVLTGDPKIVSWVLENTSIDPVDIDIDGHCPLDLSPSDDINALFANLKYISQ